MLTPTDLLTELYVLIDEWDKTQPPPPSHPGPTAHRSRREVLTLAIASQWRHFSPERAFWRSATHHLRPLFPTLPSRVEFGRAVLRHQAALAQIAVALGQRLTPLGCAYEILDATGVETRDARRRGRGWFADETALGRCSREGWYAGMRLLVCVTPAGAITGFGLAPANTNERQLAETFSPGGRLTRPRSPVSAAPSPPALSPMEASPGSSGKRAGWTPMAQSSSVLPKPPIGAGGPRRGATGWRTIARSSKPPPSSCSPPSVWRPTAGIPSRGCWPGARPRSPPARPPCSSIRRISAHS